MMKINKEDHAELKDFMEHYLESSLSWNLLNNIALHTEQRMCWGILLGVHKCLGKPVLNWSTKVSLYAKDEDILAAVKTVFDEISSVLRNQALLSQSGTDHRSND